MRMICIKCPRFLRPLLRLFVKDKKGEQKRAG